MLWVGVLKNSFIGQLHLACHGVLTDKKNKRREDEENHFSSILRTVEKNIFSHCNFPNYCGYQGRNVGQALVVQNLKMNRCCSHPALLHLPNISFQSNFSFLSEIIVLTRQNKHCGFWIYLFDNLLIIQNQWSRWAWRRWRSCLVLSHYWTLLNTIEHYWTFLDWAILGCIGLYRVVLGCTGNWAVLDRTGR